MARIIQAEASALALVAPSGGVVALRGVLIGAIFAVAMIDAAEGAEFIGRTRGVFELAATAHASTQAMSAGDTAYWDDSTKKITKTATGNQAIGVIVEDKATTDTTAIVALVPKLFLAGTTIANITLAAVTGVDGTGSNAASKADVDTRFATIEAKINAMLAAEEAGGVSVA